MPLLELEQTKEVADQLGVAVTGGEQDCEIATWKRMIDMRQWTSCSRTSSTSAGSAARSGSAGWRRPPACPITPHCANLGLVTLFTMHLLRAIEGAGKYLEFSIEGADYYPWQDGLFVKSPYEVYIPTRPRE